MKHVSTCTACIVSLENVTNNAEQVIVKDAKEFESIACRWRLSTHMKRDQQSREMKIQIKVRIAREGARKKDLLRSVILKTK